MCARAYEQKASVHLKIIAHIFLSIEKIVLDAAVIVVLHIPMFDLEFLGHIPS